MKINEKWMKIKENQRKIKEKWWKSMKINVNQCKSIDQPQINENLIENQSKSMKINENQWKLMKINEKQINIISQILILLEPEHARASCTHMLCFFSFSEVFLFPLPAALDHVIVGMVYMIDG